MCAWADIELGAIKHATLWETLILCPPSALITTEIRKNRLFEMFLTRKERFFSHLKVHLDEDTNVNNGSEVVERNMICP